jgi:hypothetical protein
VDEYEAHHCEHEIDMTETATPNRSKEIDPVPLALGDPEPSGQSRNRIAEMPQGGPRAPRGVYSSRAHPGVSPQRLLAASWCGFRRIREALGCYLAFWPCIDALEASGHFAGCGVSRDISL